jgi:hypothetical protein
VLLGDVIKMYVTTFNVLLDKEHFDEGKLKGGSYTMTPDENDAWTFVSDKNGVKKMPLRKDRDLNGDYYEIPSNSLVYIKLKQQLRLPFYVIGRHNLKIRYVYKGLLLGTGPQVDPGFEGNLFIPLHNFTTSPTRVYINGPHSSFVSIDFVRTTPFSPEAKIPAHTCTVEELRHHLSSEHIPRILIEEKKNKERKTLEDYLEGAQPRSQLAQFQADYEKFEETVRSDMNTAKTQSQANYEKFQENVRSEINEGRYWTRVERLAVFVAILSCIGVIVATLNYYRGFVADLKSETKDVKAALSNAVIGGLDKRISSLETNVAQAPNDHRDQVGTAATNIEAMQRRLDSIEIELKRYENGLTNTNSTNSDTGQHK